MKAYCNFDVMKKSLTSLEKMIIEQMLDEKSSNEIAKNFNLTLREIESIRRSIFDKLGVDNLIGFTKKAIQLRLNK